MDGKESDTTEHACMRDDTEYETCRLKNLCLVEMSPFHLGLKVFGVPVFAL